MFYSRAFKILVVLHYLLNIYLCDEDLRIVRTNIHQPIFRKPRWRIHIQRPKLGTTSDNRSHQASHRIYRGYSCKSHPSMVAILKEPKEDQLFVFCGGSLISDHLVLTAGHCASDQLYAGVLLDTEQEYIQPIQAYYLHPKFNADSLDNDICIMVLEKPLTTTKVRYVRLPEKRSRMDMSLVCNQTALIMGWGKTERVEAAGTLQCARLPIISMNQCVKLYGVLMLASQNSTICTLSQQGVDACTGDSGGPLFCDDVQVGLVSWGRDCGDPKSPGIYTRVDRYLPFIKKVILVEENHTQATKTRKNKENMEQRHMPVTMMFLLFVIFNIVSSFF